MWKSGRELAVESEPWEVRARCERGYTMQLPDLAGWLESSSAPVAVIAESGGRREDRQKLILEGWREAIVADLYSGVRYDCANGSVANWITRLARKVGLTGPTFAAVLQPSADEIIALSAADDEPDSSEPQLHSETACPPVDSAPVAPLRAPAHQPPVATDQPEPPAPARIEMFDDAAQHPLYHEVFGTQPEPRRRWRR